VIDFALISYVGIMSVTPGPNNLLLAASGVHFGWRRTLPQMLGITAGCFVLVFSVTLLFGALVGFFADIRPWLAVVGGAYLLWLSWQILTAGPPEEREGRRPMRFLESAAFQFLNPKAWVMVINAALFFAPAHGEIGSSLILSLVFVAVNLPCIALWVFTGDRLRRFLTKRTPALIFNAVMAVLMAATAVWLVVEEFLPAHS
jgi:threonine/homoserine/homoserine lactone efflux protein